MMIVANDVHQAYRNALRLLLDNYRYAVSPRGLAIQETQLVCFWIYEPKFEPVITADEKRNEVLASYMRRELELYKEGTMSAERWRDEASKFWWDLRNPDGTINSNYGTLSMQMKDAPGYWEPPQPITQWQWAKQSLLADRDTRQAVMHFNRPSHQWYKNKDFPCTMYSVFSIREDKLHYTTHMRSQDIIKGWPYDTPFFIWQLCEMAEQLELPVGEYRHVVDSLHLYQKDEAVAERMLGDVDN